MASASPQLWATASKEWVIQPKPKPGRKPKKDLAPVPHDDEHVDCKGRRIQNRAAQRAFRERKQSQLADLQARVQLYEQGEIERNVALQSIAKRLKEENETLRRENAALVEKLAKVEQERDMLRDNNDRKRWRDDSPASSVASTQRKKYKVDHDLQDTHASRFVHPYISSPQSMASSPDSNTSSDTRFSSVPFDSQADAFAAFSHLKSEAGAFQPFDCGFCIPDTPCVCGGVFQQTASVQEHKLDVNPIRAIVLGTPPPPEETSILDNLPPYQPPVPLRLRPRTTQINTIFQVSPPSLSSATSANSSNGPFSPSRPSAMPACSGDPSDCPACQGDDFGRQFCEKISSLQPCDNSPPIPPSPSPRPHIPPSSFIQPEGETITTNDAWQRLKSHPNVSFADLDMLADVVARRSRCTGPRVVLSPPPAASEPVAAGANSEEPVLLTDPHAHFREQERARTSPPVMQETCGQRRVREVRVDALREALRLLDGKFLGQ
ncbi:BZIP domain-containing protein [Mycena sanguinolenta]|uniref:BZIP domain-containing protein n=1 Tax=Mycena sanguinolenta TaxID=230812 RepID=A0A8H6XDK6_9AGAR|nr:BZIP domain-containing protein [Mycena sanguinolenta]